MTLIAAMSAMEVIEEKCAKHRLTAELLHPNEFEDMIDHGLSASEERENT